MRFSNSTELCTKSLEALILGAIEGWPHDELDVRIRYSRGVEFSGSFHPIPPRIFVNLGRRNHYPYTIKTHVAPAKSDDQSWWREVYCVDVANEAELVLFVFMHEFYHWLVKKAGRNRRQKEGRCDRFATRALADQCGAVVRDSRGRAVPRKVWDFQDLNGFVAAARRVRKVPRAARLPLVAPSEVIRPGPIRGQMMLFDVG